MSSDNTPTTGPYTVGAPHPNTKSHATFETKPSVPEYTGGGYEHWRSTEYRPHTPRQGKEDVYVSAHQLLAVVACYPLETPIEDVLADLSENDVHHNAPEVKADAGVPWDNRPDAIEVVDHARHSSRTQAQVRAWGEDAKQAARDPIQPDHAGEDVCAGCGEPAEMLATSEDWEGERCLDCAQRDAGGETIELGGGV
jgi:hypothetical protein